MLTKIHGARQVQERTLGNQQIHYDAGISTTKLAASVRLATAAALPSSTYDPVAMRLTAAAPGALSIDGVAVANGDRILVKDQATASQNGIYVVEYLGDAGLPWKLQRAPDANSNEQVRPGLFTFVADGSEHADSGWMLSNNAPVVLDTTPLVFKQFAPVAFVSREMPGGTIDGANTVFTLIKTPKLDTEHVYLNGILQHPDVGHDYTISGQTITFANAPVVDDILMVSYFK